MNIVYKLTNLDRESGRRFYVGSKTECFIEKINGVDRIVSTKTGLPYYGSSTCPLMKADMAEGHRFSAEILEEVTNKKNLLSAEDAWIVKLNAVESDEYYNIAYARVGGHMVDQTAAYNMYGETITTDDILNDINMTLDEYNDLPDYIPDYDDDEWDPIMGDVDDYPETDDEWLDDFQGEEDFA